MFPFHQNLLMKENDWTLKEWCRTLLLYGKYFTDEKFRVWTPKSYSGKNFTLLLLQIILHGWWKGLVREWALLFSWIHDKMHVLWAFFSLFAWIFSIVACTSLLASKISLPGTPKDNGSFGLGRESSFFRTMSPFSLVHVQAGSYTPTYYHALLLWYYNFADLLQLVLHNSIDIFDDCNSKLLLLSWLLNNHYHHSHLSHIHMHRSVDINKFI